MAQRNGVFPPELYLVLEAKFGSWPGYLINPLKGMLKLSSEDRKRPLNVYDVNNCHHPLATQLACVNTLMPPLTIISLFFCPLCDIGPVIEWSVVL